MSNITFARRVSLWVKVFLLAACPAVANDPAAELELAIKLAQAGETSAAVETLENALKKQPQLVANRWSAVEQAFRQANKIDELYAAVEKMDLKAFRQSPWIVGNLLQNMFQDDKSRSRSRETSDNRTLTSSATPDSHQGIISKFGTTIGERALAAARMQPANEQTETLAILREWGQLALDQGDEPAAVRRCSEMLSIVLPRHIKNEDAEKRAVGNAASLKVNLSPIPTPARFEQAAPIARLDREKGDRSN